ncbi:MAG TPA: nucleotide-binding domain containing protein [Trebonia sp.]|nr:nucleotide-binding domain containing protein [Trebonia sp.]
MIAGSCSPATLAQVADMKLRYPAFEVDPASLARGEDVAGAAVRWARPLLPSGPVLIYSSAGPEGTARARQLLGQAAGERIEQALGEVARGLVEAGVSRLAVAGGETSGAVTGALGIRSLLVGEEIEPGVPVTVTVGGPSLALVLKSGNFGSPGFLEKALKNMQALA